MFVNEEDDDEYHIIPSPTSKTGTPAAGSNRILTNAKTETGFTITVETAPGGGNSVTFDWMLVR